MQYDLILEELSDSQKAKVDKWVKPGRRTIDISSHVFPAGHERMSIPLEDPKDKKVEAPEHIESHLKQHGYEVHDYLNGRVKDKHGREMKLGKALKQSKAPDDLINHFNTDPKRNAARLHGDLSVVVSRHPYDVAGMSTGRGWTSCMDLDRGYEERHHLKHDVHEGTHVAYLVRGNDHNIENPVARIALKPHTSLDGSHTVLRPEDKTYGGAASSFGHTVHKWSVDNFPLQKGHVYMKNTKIYDDTGGLDSDKNILIHPDADHKAIANELVKRKSVKTGTVLSALYKDGNDDIKNHIMAKYGKNKTPHHRLIWSVSENGPIEHQHKMLDHWPENEDVHDSLSYGSNHDDIHERLIRSPHVDEHRKSQSAYRIKNVEKIRDLTSDPKYHPALVYRDELHHDILKHGNENSHKLLSQFSNDANVLRGVYEGPHAEAAAAAGRRLSYMKMAK